MRKRRTFREFAGLGDAASRTSRLFQQVANELERLGVRWRPTEEETNPAGLLELPSCTTVAPNDPEFARVTLMAPRGVRGWLLIHRAVLEG